MCGWLLALVMGATPLEANGAVLAELRSHVRTGTLLFSQGDCVAIKVFSGSRYTHVGAVVVEDGQISVYDSMNGPGVRKQSLEDYVSFLVPSDVEVLQPARPMTREESAAFTGHLNSQLGRPYRIKHYTTGRRSDGLHCAEYITDALIAANWFTAREPARVSPGSLWQGVRQSGRYVAGGRFGLVDPVEPAIARDENWCQRSWRETQECCSACCRQMSRWFLCRGK